LLHHTAQRVLLTCILKFIGAGIWSAGVATEMTQLSEAPGGSDKESWVLCSDGVVKHNGQDIHKLADIPQEGDTIVINL